MRVSAAEGIDAARAVQMIGYADRDILKDSLGLILAKTPEEKAAYEEAFELYFKRDDLGAQDEAESDEQKRPWQQQQGQQGGEGMGGSGGQRLGLSAGPRHP